MKVHTPNAQHERNFGVQGAQEYDYADHYPLQDYTTTTHKWETGHGLVVVFSVARALISSGTIICCPTG